MRIEIVGRGARYAGGSERTAKQGKEGIGIAGVGERTEARRVEPEGGCLAGRAVTNSDEAARGYPHV